MADGPPFQIMEEKQSEESAGTSHEASTVRTACFGVFSHKPRWALSWRGWLTLLLGIIGMGILLVFGSHPFLAVTRREKTDVLVVEGWIHEYATQAGADEFRNGNYRQVFTTGGPVSGLGGYLNDYSTAASIGAGRLKAAGIPPDRVQMVPSRVSGRDRTYGSAVALRHWFQEHNIQPPAINVVTEDMHARRTRLLFQKAFGKELRVGIVAIPNPDYDGSRWWRYSEGVREMIGESVAYVYARFLFWPKHDEESVNLSPFQP